MKVSVLMPAFNAEKYIAGAIESVLGQTYNNIELLIIDDGSTDNTLNIIQDFAKSDDRIKMISHPNMGMGNSLNKAMTNTQNEWIIRMDADDVMIENRLERQIKFVEENPEIAVASCLVYYIDEGGQIIGRSSSDLKTKQNFEKYLRSNELIGLHHPGVIMRRSIVQEVGGYRSQYWPADDLDLWNRIAEKGYLILVQQEHLLKYRIHSSSISVADSKKTRLMVRWLKQNMLLRRQGKPELSFQDFGIIEKERSRFEKLNQDRKYLAKVFYKRTVYYYSSRRMIKAIFNSFVCFVLQPIFFIHQFLNKFVLFKLERAKNKPKNQYISY